MYFAIFICVLFVFYLCFIFTLRIYPDLKVWVNTWFAHKTANLYYAF
jgi:hypothetical protein